MSETDRHRQTEIHRYIQRDRERERGGGERNSDCDSDKYLKQLKRVYRRLRGDVIYKSTK